MGPDNNYRFDVTLLAADGASVSHSVCVCGRRVYMFALMTLCWLHPNCLVVVDCSNKRESGRSLKSLSSSSFSGVIFCCPPWIITHGGESYETPIDTCEIMSPSSPPAAAARVCVPLHSARNWVQKWRAYLKSVSCW